MKKIIIVLFSLSLFSCGGSSGGGSSSGGSSNTPTITGISPNSGSISGGTNVVITGTNLSDATSISFGGVAGTNFNLISSTQITITTPASSTVGNVDVVVSGNNGLSITSVGGFQYLSNTQSSDLSSHLWHLNNMGQNVFATNTGTAGEDINFGNTSQTGNNIIVAVVDDGLEIAHEDLSANIVVNGSYDFAGVDNDPTEPSTGGGHGTSVAGLIASSDNSVGGKGVAPNAKLKGFNALSSQAVNNFVFALGGDSLSSDASIFNQSYGYDVNDDNLIITNIENQFIAGVNNLRNGKGAVYVKAAGNGYTRFANVACVSDEYSSTTCQNANMDPEAAIPYQIVVGAVNANGVKSSYSTAGSNLWISAPSSDSDNNLPGLITTDKSGCDRGYSQSVSSDNNFENNNNGLNANCKYTSTFGGTSGATPIISGVVALMLEANPNLTWRDVKHILATTADKVDANIQPTIANINGTNYTAEPTWLTNNAGYNFHNYYGFGRVDVVRAIAAATSYTTGSLGTFSQTNWITNNVNGNIPENDADGITDIINIPNNLVIEAVQIRVNATHTYTGELAIELTSPSGTKSVLLNLYNGFAEKDDLDMVLLSNAFYGENASGNWTIRIIDGHTRENTTKTFNSWQLRVFGH